MINLFSPFHQIDSGLARKHEGTGLGLSICKRLVEMMGGTIDVVSDYGRAASLQSVSPEEERGWLNGFSLLRTTNRTTI